MTDSNILLIYSLPFLLHICITYWDKTEVITFHLRCKAAHIIIYIFKWWLNILVSFMFHSKVLSGKILTDVILFFSCYQKLFYFGGSNLCCEITDCFARRGRHRHNRIFWYSKMRNVQLTQRGEVFVLGQSLFNLCFLLSMQYIKIVFISILHIYMKWKRSS